MPQEVVRTVAWVGQSHIGALPDFALPLHEAAAAGIIGFLKGSAC